MIRDQAVKRRIASLLFALVATCGMGCTRFGAVYPSRPPASPGEPIVEPTPSHVVAHTTITRPTLEKALNDAIPARGEGTFPLLRMERSYSWDRDAVQVGFGQGRVQITLHVNAHASLPLTTMEVPLDVVVEAEPILNADYQFKLQGLGVKVTSTDRRMKVADSVAGVLEKIEKELKAKLSDFSYDLKPLLTEAYQRVSKPVEFPVSDARGCARFDVLGIEAGPTILADGIEKDIALVVSPSVTMPCAEHLVDSSVPPLANVATVIPGPFGVVVPIAARYDELAKAMGSVFTDGKYFFSKEYPQLYLEAPELYASQGSLVLKMHLAGPVHAAGIDTELNGDIFLTGHPTVVDNEIRLPDLEPTIETSNFLLRLKAMADGEKIRDQAREAMRLDVGERLASVRKKLSEDLTFENGPGCFRGNVDKVEVTGVHAHANYLRVHVAVTGRASLRAPCYP